MFHSNIVSLFLKAKFAPNLIILTDFEKKSMELQWNEINMINYVQNEP